jgi:hypothetical protein
MPEWVGDLADLLQIFKFLFVVLTTGLGWLLEHIPIAWNQCL